MGPCGPASWRLQDVCNCSVYPQSLYSAVDDLRGTKADREQLEIEVKEVRTLIASDLLKVGTRL